MKDKYGEDRVLNIATFSTEGSKSAMLSACRGLGIDVDEASYINSLIPNERGSNWTLTECLYGDKKDKKPIKEFINAVEKHEGLKEIALKIEGLVKNNSVHASGIYIFNDSYTKQNAMMKSSKGVETTQMSMDDSDKAGALKIDALTVSNMDKIRSAMDMLIEDGYMSWQGSLKKTYDNYLHPKVLEYNEPKMWKMVEKNDILDLFQFDSSIGLQTAQKIKPANVVELGSANNLMRLMGEGIQPVDKYIKFRDNPKLPFKEMKEYGLNEHEIKVIGEHLDEASYVSDSQEEIMLLSMDENISNFTIPEANKLRKAVAKIDSKVLAEVKNLFFKKGNESGNRDNILKYIWDTQIMPQAGYGFSALHSMSYSLIALQNMNLAYKYPQVYWNTACLTVNSGSNENSENDKSSEYGRVSIAMGEMIHNGIQVEPPDINKAGFSFTPNAKENTIIFGLRGIHGINTDIVNSIISNRPYSSLQDFLTRLLDTKLVQNQHMLQLIKAGCFDSLDNRSTIMRQYISHTKKSRKNLTLASFNTLINLDVVPEELDLQVRFYNFRRYIYKKSIGKTKERSTKNRLFKLDSISSEFLHEHFSEDCIVDVDSNGQEIIAEYLFDRDYEKKMNPVREWLFKEETLELVNNIEFKQAYDNSFSDSLGKDEMSALGFYYHDHELKHLNKEKYNVVDFNSLSEEPNPVREYEYAGRTRYEYELHRIAGTVLDKDKTRHTVSILTTDGVVTVKLYRGNYSHYDRQISRVGSNGKKTVVDKSFFMRGNLIMFTGFRRGNQFIPRTYRNSIYQHSVALINSIDDKGSLSLKTEREKY